VSRVQIEHVGAEQQPVIVIDDFAPDPKAMIDEAATLGYAEIGMHYPGVRARVPASHLRAFLPPIVELVCDTFSCGSQLEVLEAYYSLVTLRPEVLAPIQRLPHFDGVERERIALLHFLSTDRASGTAFYRHRSTGFETVDAARFPSFRAALERDVALHGLPAPAYIEGDTVLYEQTARFAGAFNRALIYRGHALHCALLPEGVSFSPDPRRGRLTANTFLMGKP
jgi:hypothetical protein